MARREDEELAHRLMLARVVESIGAIEDRFDEIADALREGLANLKTDSGAVEKSILSELSDMRRELEAVKDELNRHGEAEREQGRVVAQLQARLQAEELELIRLKALQSQGAKGLLSVFSDEKVQTALKRIAAAVFGGIATFVALWMSGKAP